MVKLEYLINRGDIISITNGKLNITPKSGKIVPSDWINEHSNALVSQISQVVQLPIYAYTNFTVGGYQGGRFDGITLRFYEVTSHVDYYTIFNVSLNKQKQPGRLKGKQFIAPKQGALMKFWHRLALPRPRRPSELYKKINVMSEYFWQASLRGKNKLESNELSFANITHQQVVDGLKQGNIAAGEWQSSGNLVAFNDGTFKRQQAVANSSGIVSEPAQLYQEVQADQTTREVNYELAKPRIAKATGFTNYGISQQGSTEEGKPNNHLTIGVVEFKKCSETKIKPQGQSHDEWLADYDNAQEY